MQHLKRFACKCKERYCPQPTPPHPVTCVASHMCSRPRKVNDVASNMCASQRETSCCVASKMCASARNVTVPNTPPHPITCVASHMCSRPRKVKDVASNMCASQRETSCCVASKMCASARNVTVPNPPHPTTSLA